MKTREELEEGIKDTITRYKEIIFNSDTHSPPPPPCMACLDEFRKQQAIDQYVRDQKLIEDTIRKLAWEGHKRTGEVLDPEVDSTY